jgi:hypothetical protein
VDRLGQRFHAPVAGNASGAYRSSRLTGASSYGSCGTRDVVAHWAKRGRPRATAGDRRAARALAHPDRAGHDDPRLITSCRSVRLPFHTAAAEHGEESDLAGAGQRVTAPVSDEPF